MEFGKVCLDCVCVFFDCVVVYVWYDEYFSCVGMFEYVFFFGWL